MGCPPLSNMGCPILAAYFQEQSIRVPPQDDDNAALRAMTVLRELAFTRVEDAVSSAELAEMREADDAVAEARRTCHAVRNSQFLSRVAEGRIPEEVGAVIMEASGAGQLIKLLETTSNGKEEDNMVTLYNARVRAEYKGKGTKMSNLSRALVDEDLHDLHAII